jgi:hypothetical protein
MSHSVIVRFGLGKASVLPSGLKARATTPSLFAWMVRRSVTAMFGSSAASARIAGSDTPSHNSVFAKRFMGCS